MTQRTQLSLHSWKRVPQSIYPHSTGAAPYGILTSETVMGVSSQFFFSGLFLLVRAIDEWVWGVVGDLPSAHMGTRDLKNPYEVLREYIR
jgi:hypothetical protein